MEVLRRTRQKGNHVAWGIATGHAKQPRGVSRLPAHAQVTSGSPLGKELLPHHARHFSKVAASNATTMAI